MKEKQNNLIGSDSRLGKILVKPLKNEVAHVVSHQVGFFVSEFVDMFVANSFPFAKPVLKKPTLSENFKFSTSSSSR